MHRDNFLVILARALRVSVAPSAGLRYLRTALRYPGLNANPAASLQIAGEFSYGNAVVLSEGCNLIVPDGASLKLGDDCHVGRYVELGPSGRIEIGGRTSIQDRSILVGDVSLGRYCMLSLNVLMTSGVHYFDRWPALLIRDQDLRVARDPALRAAHSRPIEVEDDCWLGVNAVIAPGVRIGRGCVVGANTVVTRDLAPYSVAVGAPARVIRQRMDFVPPVRVDWRTPQHHPYFYSGFLLAEDERERGRDLGGLVALPRFALWLKGGAELRLRARAAAAGTVQVECNGASAAVSADWTELRFPQADPAGPCRFSASGGQIAVSEAWTA